MSVFDAYIRKVAEYVEAARTDGQEAREFICREAADRIKMNLPVRVGPKAHQGIILRSDTYLELGNPLAGSCAFVLWTEKPSLIDDGKITLLGPDIPESAEKSLPFAQVLIVGGEEPDGQRSRVPGSTPVHFRPGRRLYDQECPGSRVEPGEQGGGGKGIRF